MCVIMLQVVEGPNMRDQIAFYAFHSFLVEVLHMCNCKQEIIIKTNPLPPTPATIDRFQSRGQHLKIMQIALNKRKF